MTITTVGNFQSKRKTPTCITFYRNERMFGADAMALMSRKPELTFAKAYRMLGTYVRTVLMPFFISVYNFTGRFLFVLDVVTYCCFVYCAQQSGISIL